MCQLKFVIIFKPCLISHNSTFARAFSRFMSKNKMENFTDDKRKRSSNWDSSEITLRQLVQENMSTLRSNFTNSVTNSRKNSYLEKHCCAD